MARRVSDRWLTGWALGGAVVVVAASLLLTIIATGRRIAGQARDIEAALLGAHENTAALFDVATTNAALERARRDLERLRRELQPR